jgi:hypothetical protein
MITFYKNKINTRLIYQKAMRLKYRKTPFLVPQDKVRDSKKKRLPHKAFTGFFHVAKGFFSSRVLYPDVLKTGSFGIKLLYPIIYFQIFVFSFEFINHLSKVLVFNTLFT